MSYELNRQVKTVYSVGGLGNQLFVWAFARWLKQETGSSVELSHAFIRQSSGKHNSFASDLPFTALELEVAAPSARALVARLGLRLARNKKNFSLGTKVSKIMRVTKFLEVGYCGDYPFRDDLNGHQYVGYFQTFRYFQALGLKGAEILNGVETREMLVLPTSVAIHLRHGDYRHQSQEFGILPTEYYVAAISAQIEHAPVTDIKVFGLFDEGSLSMIRELQQAFPEIAFDLDCLNNPSPAPIELKMLAQFKRQIISNSSFSWWACALSEEGLKVSPVSWFRGMPEPQDLIPSNWIRVPFSWRD